jgi:ClpP class serine protease
MSGDRKSPVADPVRTLLEAHAVFMSDADEDALIDRLVSSDDVADLALRTCLCGRRIDGFDDYHSHLVNVLTAPDTASVLP